MKIPRFLISHLAGVFGIPSAAMEMLRAATTLAGVDTQSLPTELVPVNAVQFSRGLLNFAFFQSNLDWEFPLWARRQFDPADPSFVPRSHLGLTMNVTQRNWTAVGSPECQFEPIVDPAGMVTPFRDRWSIDTWIGTGGDLHIPARLNVRQSLLHHYPVVVTEFVAGTLPVRLSTFVDGSTLFHTVRVTNAGPDRTSGSVFIAMRPFNPEGVGMIRSIRFERETLRFIIDDADILRLDRAPSSVHCSTYEDGDSARHATRFESASADCRADDASMSVAGTAAVECQSGLANAYCRIPFDLVPGGQDEIEVCIPLGESAQSVSAHTCSGTAADHLNRMTMKWDDLLRRGATISTPDPTLNRLLNSSLISLLLLTDGDSITPGPASYHHFWIRDAAYMVNALDAYGHHEFTRPIIDRCFDHQTRDGYFRSQQGEWDSNGQVLWMLYEHARLTGTHHAFESRLNALRLAIRWIDRTRSRNASARERKGLLPSGISAEHLGLADQYYWDNFWCLAGIRSYIRLCRLLDRSTECDEALRIYNTFAADLIATFPAESHIPIPAAPGRGTDHGMIGSLSAVYPLQLMDLGAERLSATVRTIDASFFRDDLFMQQFIHSGLNIYLSLQTAHAYLLLGDRDRFFQILTAAIAHATPTGTFPEAIHPITKGGSMGDGHHGWAAAELLLAVKAMFVLETDNTLRLLSGVPASWFDEDRTIFVDRVPIGTGSLSLRVHNTTLSTTILIDPQPRMDSNAAPHTGHTADTWEVHLPFTVSHAFVDGAPLPTFSAGRSGSILRLAAQRSTVLIQRSTEEVTI